MTIEATEGAAGATAGGAPAGGGTPPPGGARFTSTGAPVGGGGGGDAPPPPAGAPPLRPRTEPTIPPVPLADRIKRAAKSGSEAANRKWASLLGVDDPAKVKERLDKLVELERAEQERQAATMTEIQRAQAERDEWKTKAETYETQLREATETAAYQKQDQKLRDIASEFVAPSAVRFARHEFASYVTSLDEDEQAKLGERDAKKWFQKWAAENPQFSKAAPPADAVTPGAAPPAARPAPARRPSPPPSAARKPITTGAPPARKEPTAGGANPGNDPSSDAGKTARPGQKNSMSRAEVKEFARKNGINYPG